MNKPETVDPSLAAALLEVIAADWPHASDALFEALRVVHARGVPLAYAETRIPLPHPILRWGRARWSPEAGGAWLLDTDSARLEESAVERAHGGSPLRSGAVTSWLPRLEQLEPDPLARLDAPLGAPLRVHVPGFTDALVANLDHGLPVRVRVLFATTAAAGFSEADASALHALVWAFTPAARAGRWRGAAHTIATTYVGPVTGRRVLEGALRLGEVERRDAVIWFSDLRGFTALSTTMSPEAVVQRINAMFSHVANAIHDAGGEVLKLIGDAVLAIFPYSDEASAQASVARALRSARLCAGLPPDLSIGIGLHRGEVAYGNVGAPDRLDFTVIGRTVNVASRIEGLTGHLGKRVLASAEVAACAPGQLRSVGAHALKGVPEAVEVFELIE
jgi:adenylate cyclase